MKRILSVVIIFVLIMSMSVQVFAESKENEIEKDFLSEEEVSKLLNRGQKRPATPKELQVISEALNTQLNIKRTSVTSTITETKITQLEIDTVLKELDLEDVDVIATNNLDQSKMVGFHSSLATDKNLTLASDIVLPGVVAFGRKVLVDKNTQFAIRGRVFNGTVKILDQVAGYCDGYLYVAPGAASLSTTQYYDLRNILPALWKSMDDMYTPLTGYGGFYYITGIANEAGYAPVIMNPAIYQSSYSPS